MLIVKSKYRILVAKPASPGCVTGKIRAVSRGGAQGGNRELPAVCAQRGMRTWGCRGADEAVVGKSGGGGSPGLALGRAFESWQNSLLGLRGKPSAQWFENPYTMIEITHNI